jgi:molybdate transport system substrate-binding protein
MMRGLLVGLLLLAGLAPAAADTLKVLTAIPYRPVLLDVMPDFEKQNGTTVTVQVDSAGGIAQRIRTGEAFDMVVLPITSLEPMAMEGQVLDETMTPLAKVGLGMVVSLSAPQPNIGSVEGLRRSLLDARTVAYINPAYGAPSGTYVARLFQQLGIASQMRSKSVLVSGGSAAEAVSRGQAEMALQQASDLRQVGSVRFAGMLPPGVQNYIVYGGALSAAGRKKDSALTLMSILTEPGIEPTLKRRGLEFP